MMKNLTLNKRQADILRAIIEEYIESGEPVGSDTLDKKYNLGISPATIRNEMVKLTKAGFLAQPHTSAGRIPNSQALRFYIKNLMKEKSLSVTEEVAAKEKVWDFRNEVDKLLKEATRALAEKTSMLSVATTDQGKVFHSGYANILEIPEFFDIDVTRTVLTLIDEIQELKNIFSRASEEEPIHILLGEELDNPFLRPVSFVFTDIRAGDKLTGQIGVVGPCRLNFSQAIPFVRYFGKLIEEVAKEWQ